MKVSIVGSGYVGTTLSACLADLGHEVTAIDIDQEIVDTINAGESPLHEPGLDELIAQHAGRNLVATTDYDAIQETDVTFLAIQTPSREDGSIDLSIIKGAAGMLGEALASNDRYHLIVTKSTVTPGTTENVLTTTIEEASGLTEGKDFGMAMNPEFLREGSAVADFFEAHKLVFGTNRERDDEILREVFEPLAEGLDVPIVSTGIREAEMIKYANNAFLATKVSLINEIGNICKEYSIDTYEVAEAIGLDGRISGQFLNSGLGWGGSCFPKDVSALIAVARDVGYEPELLNAAVGVNEKQPERMLDLLRKCVDPNGKRIAVLGLSFKPGTDDIRNARSIPVIQGLLSAGAKVVAYDPVATENMRERFPDIEYAESAASVLAGAHAALVVTEWDEFEALDEEFNAMDTRVVIDGRRIIRQSDDLIYDGLTW